MFNPSNASQISDTEAGARQAPPSGQEEPGDKRKRRDEYFDQWANRMDLLLDDRDFFMSDDDEDEVFYSADLSEATYSMCFDLLNTQDDFLDKVMSKFPVWEVFSDLFKIRPRTVFTDQLIRDGYLPLDYPTEFTTSSGEFMGDPISFIHLTLLWQSLVNQTSLEVAGGQPRDVYRGNYPRRPFGQNVGDDLILLKCKRKFAKILRRRADSLRLMRSKLDAISRDTAIFCEQSLWKPPDKEPFPDVPEDSRFGDLVFLDVIKGSLLTGRSKVKSDGASPFFGHAIMLSKQLAYLPAEITWTRDRSKTVLWARNYRDAVGLTKALPAWPRIMGGLDLAIGKTPDLADPRMENYLPYLYRLTDGELDKGLALEVILLLGSIWRTSNKGFVLDMNEIDLASIVSGLTQISEEEALAKVPPHILNQGHSAVGQCLSQHGVISLLHLGEELNRRYNFLRWWKGELPNRKTLVTFRTKTAVRKHKEVWSVVRGKLAPIGKPHYIRSVKDLTKFMERYLLGGFFLRDDPTLRAAFEGMPSLHFQF